MMDWIGLGLDISELGEEYFFNGTLVISTVQN